jgi:polysaccharide export outer membrane protein
MMVESRTRRAPLRSGVAVLLMSLGLTSVGCASTGPFVWYHDLPQSAWNPASSEYTIGVGDALTLRVYEQDTLNTTVKVRSDGRISMALLGEVAAAGKHPQDLARELEGVLKQFVVTPHVTVVVDQSQPVTVNVLGEAVKTGALTLERPARLLQALAQTGGVTEYADKSEIFVIRQFPTFTRIRFTYDSILNNQGGAATFPLQSGDVIQIE